MDPPDLNSELTVFQLAQARNAICECDLHLLSI